MGQPKALPLEKTDFKRLWNEEERRKAAETAAEPTAYDDNSGAKGSDLADAKSDWELLRLTAAVVFPSDLASKFNLAPRVRLAAIAHVLGWKPAKIMEAGRIAKTTLYNWMKREEFAAFVQAFEYHRGTKDSKELIDKNQYAAIQTLLDLMNNTTVSSSTRKDIAQWFFEQKHGKPKETREVLGTDVKKLTQELMAKRGAMAALDLLDDVAPEAGPQAPEDAN